MARIKSRLSYANIAATLALFIALGGSATAAFVITGRDIKDGSIRGVDIRDSSLRGKDLKNNSLTGADIANGSLRLGDFKPGDAPAGPQGAQGAQGAPGPQGSQGPTGPTGPGAPVLYAHVLSDGTVDAARSSGISTSNVHKTNGFYCFYGLSPAPKNAAATVDWSGSGSNTAIRETLQGDTTGCEVGTGLGPEQAAVMIGTGQDAGFYIAFYG
jgi:hypothetical protein